MELNLLPETEVTEIRRLIEETDKELNRQIRFVKTETFNRLSYANKIPHKFRIGYLYHERNKLAKQINYIV